MVSISQAPWSRERESAVPSRVSLFISILGLNLVLTYGIPPEFRGGVHLFMIYYCTDSININRLVTGMAVSPQIHDLMLSTSYC